MHCTAMQGPRRLEGQHAGPAIIAFGWQSMVTTSGGQRNRGHHGGREINRRSAPAATLPRAISGQVPC